MKVSIGKYIDFIGPYQIAEKLLFWIPKYDKEDNYSEAYDKYVHRFGEILSKTWLKDVYEYIHSKKKRKIKVHIDNYDVWSADHTLALIILPTLKKLKEVKHGSPYVDLEDVPEHLRYTETESYDNQYTFDFYHNNELAKIDCDVHTRWEYVLDEMIFAFEHIVDESWEEEFDEPREPYGLSGADWVMNTKRNYKKMKVVEDRIENGLVLFGKYYRGLWD